MRLGLPGPPASVPLRHDRGLVPLAGAGGDVAGEGGLVGPLGHGRVAVAGDGRQHKPEQIMARSCVIGLALASPSASATQPQRIQREL